MATYQSVHLATRPNGFIVPGETFQIKMHDVPSASTLQDGEILLRVLYLSVDPAMRSWLDDKRSYHTPVQIGEVMHGFSIGVIEDSRSTKVPKGTYATASTSWTEIVRLHEDSLSVVDTQPGIGLTDWLGCLGFTGMTAYFGIVDVAKAQPGNLVVVTGGAGATGSIAGQIAKLKGAKVIGIAGSEKKCKWLSDEMGFDGALNYKAPNFKANFNSATEGLIDVFFDNVGGPILDMAL
ncbi:hypothetical protein S40288_06691 [Stachybotrys chartarum IBT 40288]|nr:hypothetical protein S40288_06691 [Stachybotrys chartarum IBT 40288]